MRKGYPEWSELGRDFLRRSEPSPLPYCAGAGVTGGRECVSPSSGRKWSLARARGLWSGLFHLLPLESVFYSGASEGRRAGSGGQFSATLLSLDGLFIVPALGQKGAPGRGGGGSARALNLYGDLSKAPSLF